MCRCAYHFSDIIKTNGEYLRNEANLYNCQKRELVGVKWLNKASHPKSTAWLEMVWKNEDSKWVPNKRGEDILYLAIANLCPGLKNGGECRVVPDADKAKCGKCQYHFSRVPHRSIKYPDTNRLIDFDDHLADLDQRLNALIKERLHNRARIARMNRMGEKVITCLLKAYFEHLRNDA